jgi:hypothetical protein
MNQKSFLIAAIFAAAALYVIATPMYASILEERNGEDSNGDTSTTSTHQDVKQKNTGSGESTNFNCGENLIKAGTEEQECHFED